VWAIGSCAWDEHALTWTSRPAIDGPLLGTAGAVGVGDAVEFDLAPAIPADGTYCFAVDTLSGNMVKYASREAGAAGPEVALVVSEAAPPTTTSSPSTTSTIGATTTESSTTTTEALPD
jgi:hypothetical protein